MGCMHALRTTASARSLGAQRPGGRQRWAPFLSWRASSPKVEGNTQWSESGAEGRMAASRSLGRKPRQPDVSSPKGEEPNYSQPEATAARVRDLRKRRRSSAGNLFRGAECEKFLNPITLRGDQMESHSI
ncbi:hypothetical protein MTO96_001411 [Rhipicephalus appendiculatus]